MFIITKYQKAVVVFSAATILATVLAEAIAARNGGPANAG